MINKALSSGLRQRLGRVAGAAVANPFSPQRDDLDREIIGTTPGSPDDSLDALLSKVDGLVAELAKVGIRTFADAPPRDRDVIERVLLFDAFHRFMSPLDKIIEDQTRRGAEPAPVDCAEDALRLLSAKGFSTDQAINCFGLFYQLRRAFHFIQRRLIGNSACMRRLRMGLWNNVFSSDLGLYDRHLRGRMDHFSTMLLGPTGAGKGMAAAAIGRSGFIPFDVRRRQFAESFVSAFTAVNLSQYPATLIESELFGHRKGAFTGAVEAHSGVFARCSSYGAIFLDEIGEIETPVQIKLLKVLEDRTFSPIGSHEQERFGGRIIAATNRPLDALRREHRFRDDLYYRLCSDVIVFPSLRQRFDEDDSELPALLASILTALVGAAAPMLQDHVQSAIRNGVGLSYPWPGNVRELEQCVRRILLTGHYDGDRSPDVGGDAVFLEAISRAELTADGVLAGYAALLHRRQGTLDSVARRLSVDTRTARKYLRHAEPSFTLTSASTRPDPRAAE